MQPLTITLPNQTPQHKAPLSAIPTKQNEPIVLAIVASLLLCLAHSPIRKESQESSSWLQREWRKETDEHTTHLKGRLYAVYPYSVHTVTVLPLIPKEVEPNSCITKQQIVSNRAFLAAEQQHEMELITHAKNKWKKYLFFLLLLLRCLQHFLCGASSTISIMYAYTYLQYLYKERAGGEEKKSFTV